MDRAKSFILWVSDRFSADTDENASPRVRYDLSTLMLVVLAGPVVGFFLSLGGELVPDKLVADALVEGVRDGSFEEENYSISRLGHRSDNFSECIALTIGFDDPEGSTPIETALTSASGGKCTIAVPMLLAYAENGDLVAAPYFRYWHGHTSYTRPALAALGVTGMRTGAWGIMIAAFIAVGVTIARRYGWVLAAALLAPLALATDFATLADTAHQSLALAVTLAGAAFVAHLAQGRRTLQLLSIGAIAGSATSFIDLLTTPIVATTLLITIVLISSFDEGHRNWILLSRGVSLGVGWSIGYVTMWVAKWILAALVVGYDEVRKDITGQVSFRLTGEHELVSTDLLAATRDNLNFFLGQPFAWPLVVGSGALAVVSVGRYLLRTGDIISPLILLSPVAIPAIWYEMMSNHTQIHNWITFRACAISVGTIGATAVLLWRTQSFQQSDEASSNTATSTLHSSSRSRSGSDR